MFVCMCCTFFFVLEKRNFWAWSHQAMPYGPWTRRQGSRMGTLKLSTYKDTWALEKVLVLKVPLLFSEAGRAPASSQRY